MTVEPIPDKIGGGVQLDRDPSVGELLSASAAHRFVALIGSSGAGKTVVAKRQPKRPPLPPTFCGLVAVGFVRYVEAFAVHQGLGHPLHETLAHGRCRQGLVVIDGAERLRRKMISRKRQRF